MVLARIVGHFLPHIAPKPTQFILVLFCRLLITILRLWVTLIDLNWLTRFAIIMRCEFIVLCTLGFQYYNTTIYSLCTAPGMTPGRIIPSKTVV